MSSVAFLPNGRRVISCATDDTARLWDLKTGKQIRKFDKRRRLVVPAGDGRRALGKRGKHLVLWDLRTGRDLQRCSGHEGNILGAVFGPDERRAISCSVDGTARLWDLETGREICRFEGHTKRVFDIVWAPDDTLITSSHDETIRLWNIETGAETGRLQGHEREARALALSPDGRRLASASHDRTIRVWDLKTRRTLHMLEEPTQPVQAVTFLPGGEFLVSGGNDKLVRVWRIETEQVVHEFKGHDDFVLSLDTGPEGRYVVSGCGADKDEQGQWNRGDDFSVRLWRLPNLKPDRKKTPTIAVLGFAGKGAPVKLAPLRKLLTQMLAGGFARTPGLQAVERSQVETFRKSRSRKETGLLDGDSTSEAGRALDADYLLTGTFSAENGTVTVEAKLYQVGREQPIGEWTLTTAERAFTKGAKALQQETLSALDLNQPP